MPKFLSIVCVVLSVICTGCDRIAPDSRVRGADTSGASSASRTPQPAKGLSVAEARTLASSELAQRSLGLLGDRIVEVAGVPPKGLPDQFDRSLSDLSLALQPKSAGWPGVCESKILSLSLDAGPEPGNQDEHAEARVDDMRMRSVYKVRGDLDLNTETNFAAANAVCARGRPFAEGYFSAPESRAALDAGLILAAAREAAAAKRRPFAFSCAKDIDCTDSRAILGTLDAEHILSVDVVEDCPAGKGCYEIALEAVRDGERIVRQLRATTYHRGVGRGGYGILRIERLEVFNEQPFPQSVL